MTAALNPNGCEATPGLHATCCLVSDSKSLKTWLSHTISLTLNTGDILVFGSYLAHRSGANTSTKDRRAIYATYNCAAEGNLHDQYYADRKNLWPATHMRKEGVDYEEGRVRYAFGSPMLTVEPNGVSA